MTKHCISFNDLSRIKRQFALMFQSVRIADNLNVTPQTL